MTTLGEEPDTEAEITERKAYYTQAHMSVYPVQGSSVRLCAVTDTAVPRYSSAFGWDYEVWLASPRGTWQRLDYGDAQFVPSALES